MHQIASKLWVGSQADFEALDVHGTTWSAVHACKEPYHRQALGYTGRSAPPDHPEYLWARRGNRLILNLIDGPDPKYVNRAMIDEALRFIDEQLELLRKGNGHESLILHCNQGGSRAPTIGMLYLAPHLPENFADAEDQYRESCPSYAPGIGMREFARIYWNAYRARAWDHRPGALHPITVRDGETLSEAAARIFPDEVTSAAALAKGREIWHAFCECMKTDPALARDQLIKSLVQALSAAENAGPLAHGPDQSSPD